MKKAFASFLLAMAVSASCFAAGASGNFAKEEKAADSLVEALTGNSVTYSQAASSFSADMKKEVTEERFKAIKNEIESKIGKLKDVSFVGFEKLYNVDKKAYAGADRLQYIGFANGKPVALGFVFVDENNKPMMRTFSAALLPERPAQQPAKK